MFFTRNTHIKQQAVDHMLNDQALATCFKNFQTSFQIIKDTDKQGSDNQGSSVYHNYLELYTLFYFCIHFQDTSSEISYVDAVEVNEDSCHHSVSPFVSPAAENVDSQSEEVHMQPPPKYWWRDCRLL